MKYLKNAYNTIIFLFISFCFILFFSSHFKHAETHLQHKIDLILQKSIIKDYEQRFSKTSIVFTPSVEKKTNGHTSILKDSIDEYVGQFLIGQYILIQSNPIKVNNFKAIFTEELTKHGITSKAGIIYRMKENPQYSDNDSTSPLSAYCTPINTLDLKKTISIQGWVNYDWKTILQQNSTKTLFILFGCYFAILSILFLPQKIRKIRLYLYKSKNKLQIDNITLDTEKKELYINKKEYPITKLDFELLYLFLHAPKYMLTREDIKHAFWPKEEDTNDKINSHINTLRKILRNVPGYDIITEKGKGYHLLLP